MSKTELTARLTEELSEASPVAKRRKKKQESEQPAPAKTNGFFGKLKERYFTIESIAKACCFEINIPNHYTSEQLMTKFFAEFKVPLLERTTTFDQDFSFISRYGAHLAFKDGIPFLMHVLEDDPLSRRQFTIRVPIWSRNKAKEIIRDYALENRPVRSLIRQSGYGSDQYPIEYATQHQFVRPDVYNYVDKVINRISTNKEWYESVGKAHKETFLLHGAPGTGKTSLYMHFSAKLNANVHQLTPMGFVEQFDELCSTAVADSRAPLVVLIEDIDAYDALVKEEYRSRDGNLYLAPSRGGERTEAFSYSTFINALDGSRKMQNMLVFMSSNYKHKLIPSIYRKGRVDHQLDIIPFTSKEIATEVNTNMSDFIASFPEDTFGIANIIDLRYCTTQEEISEFAQWLGEDAALKAAEMKGERRER